MNESPRLRLPLLSPAQAQKHVTVNEALLRLDALSQLVLRSRLVDAPPPVASDGDCYAVPATAAGDWAGRAGQVAVFVGGGWDFVTPATGWRAYVEDEAVLAVYSDGWHAAASTATTGGSNLHEIQFDHAVGPGAQSQTIPAIPGAASVIGITGLVVEAIGGPGSFQIGVAGAADRYGSGIGTGTGSWLRGLTASPLTYWTATPLILTPQGADFDGSGLLRLIVYVIELPLPT